MFEFICNFFRVNESPEQWLEKKIQETQLASVHCKDASMRDFLDKSTQMWQEKLNKEKKRKLV